MQKNQADADQIVAEIIKGMEEVKAQEIQILDLRSIENTVCDYFVICSGTSNTQVNAIVNSVQKIVSKSLKEKPWHIEGSDNAEWVLMDYVHVWCMCFKSTFENFTTSKACGAMRKVCL